MKEKKIEDTKELEEVISFLKTGFPNVKNELDKFYSHLKISNQKIGFYGFMHFDNDHKIDGAILTPLQCQKDSKVLNKPIINIASWFMLKKSRGIKVINFAKFFLNELKSYYITDYSANKEAYKIFKFLNFKDLLATKICSSFLIIFATRPLQFGINNKVTYQKVKKKYKEIISYNLSDEIEFNEFSYKHESFIYASRKRESLIPIFLGFSLKIPIFEIIWCSDEICLSRNWKLLCKTIFLQRFIIGIYCYFNQKNSPNINKFDRFNTIKFKKKFLTYGSTDEKLIYTLGSEMMIF